MRKFTPVLITLMFATLGGILYATTATEPTKTLPPEDTLIKAADYPAQNAQIQVWQTRADIALNGKPYTMYGDAVTDPYGGVTLLESPTANAVVILPDGSCDLYLGGIEYRFTP